MSTTTTRWIGLAIACADAGPVARFYDRLLGFEMGNFETAALSPAVGPSGAACT